MSETPAKYLYVIMHPNEALVASMLPPEEFGKHYTLGSSRYYHGLVIFAEIDQSFRDDYFPIDDVLDGLEPKPDGNPKRTKFVKTYRVLEHLSLSTFKDLYITSSVGKVLRIEKQPYNRQHEPGWIRTFQEVCPLHSCVLTYMTPPEFGSFITDPNSAKGAPKVFFAQIDFHTEEFLATIREDPFINSPIPNVHPQKLRDQIEGLKINTHKRVKGVTLESRLNQRTFVDLRTGLWLAAGEELLFYPVPEPHQLETEHYEWWRSLNQ